MPQVSRALRRVSIVAAVFALGGSTTTFATTTPPEPPAPAEAAETPPVTEVPPPADPAESEPEASDVAPTEAPPIETTEPSVDTTDAPATTEEPNSAPPTTTFDKTNSLGGLDELPAFVQPGDSFDYVFRTSCSADTQGCVDLTITDVIPAEVVVDEELLEPLDVEGLRDVTWDDETRTLTVVYAQPIADPGGTGLEAGARDEFTVTVTLPEDSTVEAGTPIVNEATATATNAAPVVDDTTVEVDAGFVIFLTPDPTNTIAIDKTNTAGGADPPADNTFAQPGQSYTYNLVASCSNINIDCVNLTVVDTFPSDVIVVESSFTTGGCADIAGLRDVTYVPLTRTLTIVYIQPLANPPGALGKIAGTSDSCIVSVTLPADTELEHGAVIPNQATVSADNVAASATDPSNVNVDIPVVLDSATTKSFSDPSAIAGDPNAVTTIELEGINQSSNSAEVTEMTIEESDPDVFEYLNFTGVTVDAPYPEGAELATLYVCPQASAPCDDTEWVEGGTGTPPGPSTLTLPGSVPADQVVGVRVVFTAAPPGFIENQARGGTASVDIDMALRNTVRSTDVVISTIPSTTIINNTATTTVDDEDPDTDPATSSDDAQYQILPPTIQITPTKAFFSDNDGDFQNPPEAGDHAVIGENSGVSMIVTATNASAFPISEITITEPAPSPPAPASEFEKFNPATMQLTYPTGAANANVVVTYEGGATTSNDYPAPGPGTIPLHPPDAKVTSITVTFTGDPAVDGGNTIQPGAPGAGLRIHGNLNGLVDETDIAGSSEAAGIDNCVAVEGEGTPYPGGTGTGVGTTCVELPVEARDASGTGEKIPSQFDLPIGNPVLFTMRTTNNGNLPLIDLVVSDPPVGTGGVPPTPASPSAWYWGMLVGADVQPAAMAGRVTIEVYTVAEGWQPLPADSPPTGGGGPYPEIIGVRARIAVLNPTETFDLRVGMQSRVPLPPGPVPTEIVNCYGISADTTNGEGEFDTQTNNCSPPILPVPITESASINKSIAPETLPQPIPGMAPQTAEVTLQIRNNGSILARMLQITDNDVSADADDVDGDFWDAVDFSGITSVQAPAVGELRDANQLRIDAWVDADGAGPGAGSWVLGSVTSPGSPSVPVPNSQVRGLRFTFTDNSTLNDGYVLTPCSSADVTCAGIVEFNVTPRQTLVSTGEPLPDTDPCPDPEPAPSGCSAVLDTASGAFNTRLHPGEPAIIPDVSDDLVLVPGDPALDVNKGPEISTVQPGQLATFTLTTTNSGTANLPALTVSDPLPEGILFDDTYADATTGQPYTVAWSNLPAGYPAPPEAVFEQTPDPDDSTRVGLLRWTFPGWDMPPNASVSILYRYTLEPGVVEGQSIVNTMGASSPVDDLVCSDPDDGEVTDGEFGDGLYCTDPADVTVTAGASFASRKWVAGTPELGWYNQATGQLGPVGGVAGCLSLDAGGRLYTTNPCIAITNPGEPFYYVLRLQNAGTEPALTMTVVDTFPAPGDTGVFGAARGTQWTNAPTLAGPAEYSGPATGTIQYTTGSPCAGGAASWPCDDADWTAGPTADATGLRLLATFDPAPLPPGGIVDISFSMTTPADVPRVADPTVAYNSIAHSETTRMSSGSVRELAPLEPLKVGVATLYGNLEVVKEIAENGNPGNLPLDDLEFTFSYACTLTNGSEWSGNGTVTATPTTPETVTGIPSGSECVVTETGTNGGIPSDPVTVTIEPSVDPLTPVVATATFTNDFPLGELSVIKEVTEPVVVELVAGPYSVTVDCTFNGSPVPGFPVDVEVTVGTPTVIDTVPVGSVCTVEETDDNGATTVTYEPSNADGIGEVTVPPEVEAQVSVTITNTFATGSLMIEKTVSGPGAPEFSQGPFVFDVSCSYQGAEDVYSVAVVVPGSADGTPVQSEPVTGLPIGAECTVTEIDSGGADIVTPQTVTIEENEQGNVAFVGVDNPFSAGTIAVAKGVDGSAADSAYVAGLEFTIAVECAVEDTSGTLTTVLDDEVTVAGDGVPVTVTGDDGTPALLPLGARCWGSEAASGGTTAIAIDHDSYETGVEVVADAEATAPQELLITATNTFDAAQLVVAKAVVNEPDPNAVYAFAIACTITDSDGTVIDVPTLTGSTPFTLGGGESATFDVLVGSTCTVTETSAPGGAVVTYSETGDTAGGASGDGAVTIGGTAATVTVTNTFERVSPDEVLPASA